MFLKNMPRGSRGQETGRRKMGGDYTVVSSVGCSFSLHKEILDLKAKLSVKESELLRLDCSSSNTILMPGFNSGPDSCTNSCAGSSGGDQSLLVEAEEWQAKYERLVEAHKKLQRNNICLEEKLLKLVEKFDSEKNLMTRDLATQTQQVVEGKLTIQQLHKQNTQLKSDLGVALNLLQMKPSSFIAQKVDSLPEDLQLRVRQYATEKPGEKRNFRNGGQKITISVPNGGESVSAAILAKVLEERENERKKEQKFCIDIGTQTHGWQFPDVRELVNHGSSNKLLSMPPDYSLLEELGYLGSEKEIASARERILAERAFFEETDYEESDDDDEEDAFNTEMGMQKTHVSNILLSSLIQPPPSNIVDQRPLSQSSFENISMENNEQSASQHRSAHGSEENDQSIKTEKNHLNMRIYPANENMNYKSPNEESFASIKTTEFKPSSQHLASMTNISILSSTRTMFSPPQTPDLSQQSSISSILSLTQQASTTPTLTSNAFFKRSFSNTSYSAYTTDM